MKIARVRKIVVAGLLLCILGCSRDVEFEQLFSPMYRELEAELFGPEGKLHAEDHKKRGSWNPKTKRGSYQIRGILTADSGDIQCGEVLKLVDDFVRARTTKYHVEGESFPTPAEPLDKHAYAMWMYNWQKRHGELHVWLFPYPDGTRMGFAIYHYEEKLK